MSWPADLRNVNCINFPPAYLLAIKDAITNKEVTWVHSLDSMFCESSSISFLYLDCLWELCEMAETVTSVELISGQPDSIDFTAAILKYKKENKMS